MRWENCRRQLLVVSLQLSVFSKEKETVATVGSGEKSLVWGEPAFQKRSIHKVFPTANDTLVRNKMPTVEVRLSIFEVDSIFLGTSRSASFEDKIDLRAFAHGEGAEGVVAVGIDGDEGYPIADGFLDFFEMHGVGVVFEHGGGDVANKRFLLVIRRIAGVDVGFNFSFIDRCFQEKVHRVGRVVAQHHALRQFHALATGVFLGEVL